jgi:hypothetical protein
MKKIMIIIFIIIATLSINSQEIEIIKSLLIQNELLIIDYENLPIEKKNAINSIIEKVFLFGNVSDKKISIGIDSYYSLKVDEVNDDIVKFTDGTIIEINGYLGYVSYGKKAFLYKYNGSTKIWIEGKKSYSCTIIKTGYARSSQGEISSIKKVYSNGSMIELNNGNMYEISSFDSYTVNQWGYGYNDVLITLDGYMVNLQGSESPINIIKVR